jgi:hypothetical protein
VFGGPLGVPVEDVQAANATNDAASPARSLPALTDFPNGQLYRLTTAAGARFPPSAGM